MQDKSDFLGDILVLGQYCMRQLWGTAWRYHQALLSKSLHQQIVSWVQSSSKAGVVMLEYEVF